MSDPTLRDQQEVLFLQRRLQQRHSGCLMSLFYLTCLLVLLAGLALLLGCESRGSLLQRNQHNRLEVSVSAPMQGNAQRRRMIDLHLGGPSLRLQINLQDDHAPLLSETFDVPTTQK